MIDRRDLGSWVEGPGGPRAPEGYRGARLGLPEDGVGALARWGRRFAALLVDWVAALLVVRLLAPGLATTSETIRNYDARYSLAVLGVFALERVLLTWLAGASFGQRLLGTVVVRTDGARAGIGRVLIRTLLLCLAIPALLTDSDGRGLHDRAAGTMELQAR